MEEKVGIHDPISLLLIGWIATDFQLPIPRLEKEIKSIYKRELLEELYDLGGEG